MGTKVSETIDEIKIIHILEGCNKDTLCILVEKCEGEAYSKTEWLGNKDGIEEYMISYRWFADT